MPNFLEIFLKRAFQFVRKQGIQQTDNTIK